MSDWFRHFFGFPGNHGRMPDFFEDDSRLDREEDADRNDIRPFHHHSPFSETSEIFNHFEEMFKNFERMFQNIGHEDLLPPSFGPQEHDIEDSEERNFRDKMLKIPDSDSNQKGAKGSFFGGWTEEPMMDTDLDDRVASEKLDQIVPEIYSERPRFFDKHSYKSSVSVHIKSNDGKIEEHRTVKDSDGNVNVTVRRSLGDQTHVITTKTDGSGQSEKREEFINMDEGSLKDFEQKWKVPRHLPLLGDEDQAMLPRNEVLKEKESSYFDIIRRFFGKNPNSD